MCVCAIGRGGMNGWSKREEEKVMGKKEGTIIDGK